jgi:hypothetical protein
MAAKNGASPSTAPADQEARYTATLEKRVGEILAALKLSDADKNSKVHDIIIEQYRALNDWQNENQAKIKDKSLTADQKQAILATRQPLHDKFIAALNEQLTPEQVEIVKDKMTYNTVKVTYDNYCKFVPQLTDEQKAKILELLKQGREEAMDGGSQEEKAAIFKKYKGKINLCLSSQGIDMKKQTKDYMDAQKKGATTKDAQ